MKIPTHLVKKRLAMRRIVKKMEAEPGIEPRYTVLQTAA